MIESITVTNYLGESIELSMRSPADVGLFIRKVEGLGPPRAMVNMSEVLTTDKAFYNSARARNRNIVLYLGFWLEPSTRIEDTRHDTYQYFPVKYPVTVEVKTDVRTLTTTGYVESNEPNIFSKASDTIISILCEDAYFEAKATSVGVFGGTQDGFEFPFSNESLVDPLLEFSVFYSSPLNDIWYGGEVSTGIIIWIDFKDAVTDLEVHNLTTEQNMTFDDTLLGDILTDGWKAGDQLRIDTRVGSKSITAFRSGVAYNVLNAYDSSVDGAGWIYFQRGYNRMFLDSATGLSEVDANVLFKEKYQGV